MADQKMPRIDLEKEFSKLSETDQHFIKKLQNMNIDRAEKVKRMRTRNRYTGLALGGFVLGIYSYTIYAMKQEKFLDFEDMPDQKKSS